MKIISAIYRRVRHPLHDDWAYGNDLDAKPWDFQTEELALKTCVEHFNSLYYDESDAYHHHHDNPFGSGELSPIDCNYLSVLGEPVELSQSWKENYEQWLETGIRFSARPWHTWRSNPWRVERCSQSSSFSLCQEVKIWQLYAHPYLCTYNFDTSFVFVHMLFGIYLFRPQQSWLCYILTNVLVLLKM